MAPNPEWWEAPWIVFCCSLTKSCPTVCNSMVCSVPGLPVPKHNLVFLFVVAILQDFFSWGFMCFFARTHTHTHTHTHLHPQKATILKRGWKSWTCEYGLSLASFLLSAQFKHSILEYYRYSRNIRNWLI